MVLQRDGSTDGGVAKVATVTPPSLLILDILCQTFPMRRLTATICLTALMLFAATPVVAGDFEDADAAYEAGNYEETYRLLKPLAEQGHAAA